MAEIKSVDALLNQNISIPPYQRPYKWSVKNIHELLNDISHAINDADKYSVDGNSEFKYRIGTIIVHRQNNEQYEIVDGQQRILSLTLIKKTLDNTFKNSILKQPFYDPITQVNIHDNYIYIQEWCSLLSNDQKDKFRKCFKNVLEVVYIEVDNIAEAFQLFDSQNSRGKPLEPHDLLKAYHLREMLHSKYEMEQAVNKWEAHNTDDLTILFDHYLFPIWNWSQGNKNHPFTSKDIDTYKGIKENSDYSYAKRAQKASPYFQVTEPFIAGNDFFEMTEHYLFIKQVIEKEINNNKEFKELLNILADDDNNNSTGFKYAKSLFYCALFYYYDKFHNFDEMVVKKLFIWAFMIRVDMKNLGQDTINKYAIGGEGNDAYSNSIPVFLKIRFARMHDEIAFEKINVLNKRGENNSWKKLCYDLCTLIKKENN